MSVYSGTIDALLALTPTEIAALVAGGVTEFDVADTAANIEALTQPSITLLGAIPVSQIAATDASVSLTVAQVIALEATMIPVSVPAGDAVTIVDTAANIEALTPAAIAMLQAIPIIATDASVSLTAAQVLALEAGSDTVSASVPAGNVALVDTVADLEGLSAGQLLQLPATGVTRITAADTVANLENLLGTDQISELTGIGVSGAIVRDTAANLLALTTGDATASEALATLANVNTALGGSGPPSYEVADTVADIEALTPAAITLLKSIPVTQFDIVDTAANIEALTPAAIMLLEAIPVARITASDASVSLTVAQATTLEAGNLRVSVPAGDTVTLADTVANLEALTAAQVSQLPETGVTGITVADTVANLETLGPPQISLLRGIGVSGAIVTDSAVAILGLTEADTTALANLNAALGGSGAPAYAVVDTGADITSDLSQLASDQLITIGTIDVTSGTVEVSSGGQISANLIIGNGSTLSVDQGVVFEASANFVSPNGSTLNIGQGGTLDLTGGSTDFGGTVQGLGTLEMEGAAVSQSFDLDAGLHISLASWGLAALQMTDQANLYLSADVTYDGIFTLGFAGSIYPDGYTLKLSGDSSSSGVNSFLGGAIFGPGTVEVTGRAGAGNDLEISGGGILEDGGSGTITQLDSGQNGDILLGISSGDTAEVLIDSGSTYVLDNSAGEVDIFQSPGATTTVENHGTFEIEGGLSQVQGNFVSDGTVTFVTIANVSSTLELEDGNEALLGKVSGPGTIAIGAGATAELGSEVDPGVAVAFEPGSGITLKIDADAPISTGSTLLLANTITGFANGGTIDLANIANVAGSHADMDYDTRVLTIAEGGQTYTLQFDPGQDFSGDYFHLGADNNGTGTTITEDMTPCYCRGTRIATERGEIAVEELAIGDRIVTSSGALRPIKWIGRRSYAGRFVIGRADILPICIKSGALGENVPRRDLWISPHHAMYFRDEEGGGMLIEAKDLINGVSIVQAETARKVEYFHIELETHDVIIAEGALSESFLDDDSRGMFHNAHEFALLYPGPEPTAARYCAPRVADGYAIEAVRCLVAARSGLLPWATGTARVA